MTQAFHNALSTIISKFDGMRHILFQHMDNINARLASFEIKFEEIERFVKTKKNVKGIIPQDEDEIDKNEVDNPNKEKKNEEGGEDIETIRSEDQTSG